MRLSFVASCWFVSLCFQGCTRDLTLPEAPGPGSITGRVLLAEPGRIDKAPLANAEVRILGSGFATVTSPAGTFALASVELTTGLLLVRADVGGVTRQRVLQLSDYGTGPKKQVNVGDIVLGENARVRGKVLRGDLSSAGGHSGTTIFVPAGPFTALTADDGSYSFDQMPEGPVELYAFRTGYEPATLGALSLRSGETVELRDFSLAPAVSTVPGLLRGALRFVPEASGVGDAAVRLLSTAAPIDATLQPDGAFQFSGVPVGLYRLVATRSGYGQLDVINVLMVSGAQVDVGELTLTTAPAFDAGPPPVIPDGGTVGVDAGSDAGVDAGFDAGVDAGSTTNCTVQMDCVAGRWCDRGQCVPLCASDADCGFGRVCDSTATRTCVTSCVGQCPAGQVCNAMNQCQAVCDATFPCPSGQKCSASRCVPECSVNADCNNPFLSCDLGACRRNNVCVLDDDCPREQLCTNGQCGARPTNTGVRPDGGTWSDGGVLFACGQACHCRSGERCDDGFCEPDVVPTRFVALDAGGNGLTAATPSGDFRGVLSDGGHVVALLAQDRWDVGATAPQVQSQTTVAGGFSVCGPNRWSRDVTARTTFTGNGGSTAASSSMLNAYASNAGVAMSDIAFSQLRLEPTGSIRCGYVAALGVRYVTGLTLEDLDVAAAMGGCSTSAFTHMIRVQNSTQARLSRLRLLSVTGTGNSPFRFLDFVDSAGLVEDLRTEPFQVNAPEMRVVSIATPTGPVTVRRLSMSRFTNPAGSAGNFQLALDGCGVVPTLVEDIEAEWPVAQNPGFGQSNGLRIEACNNLTVRRVRVTSANHPGTGHDQNYGVYLRDSGGTLNDVTIDMPAVTSSSRRVAGIQFEGPRAVFDVSDLVIRATGGAAQDSIAGVSGVGNQGIRFDSITTGPLTVRRADVSLKSNIAPHGVVTHYGVSLAADVSILDSRVEVEGTNTCSADVIGLLLREAVRVERTTVIASRGAFVAGLFEGQNATGRVELYGNSIKVGASSGSSSCSSRGSSSIFGSYAVIVDGVGNQLKAVGNTFESFGQTGQTGNSLGLACAGTPTVFFASNIVMTGRGADTRLLSFMSGSTAGSGCFAPSNFSNNYWVNGVANTLSTQERLFDAGIATVGGNTWGGTSTCFATPAALADGGAGFPHFLTPGSPCADRGELTVSNAGVTIDRDLFNRPRDGGAGPDIGAVEGP